MEWIDLTSLEQLNEIEKSNEPVLIFKHSTRCVVSNLAKKNFVLESVLIPEQVSVYHLDILQHRDISNEIARKWSIRHESPQLLLIQNNVCTYDASHSDIHVADAVTRL